MSYRISTRALQFSAAHFTIFPDGTAERLHGHNYSVVVELEGETTTTGLLIDFGEIKEALSLLCRELDERTLIPDRNTELRIDRSEGGVEVRYQDRFYRFPEEDVVLLPLVNVTTEALACFLAGRIRDSLGARLEEAQVDGFSVRVEESPGQGAAYRVTVRS